MKDHEIDRIADKLT